VPASDSRRVAIRQPIAYSTVTRPHPASTTRSSTLSTTSATASWLTEIASVASIRSVANTRPRSRSGTSRCRA
jgi:hypothetical protein